jgi:RNA polymerase sigma factor (sigma-70 family)
MEVSALKYHAGTGRHGRSPLLRLQSDDHLIKLIRAGHDAAFEVLVSRYESRLLSFCRHLLNSREDAEDVLQDALSAAYHAILADERPINVRPWLYRIARNRCLNHLRRHQAIGVDSMDVLYAEHGESTLDKVHRREEFRLLVGDIHELPETQRTALILREMDALAYEQIAEAMETTVSSVKSLLVRARVSLAEASEARLLSCEAVRTELAEVAEGLIKRPGALERRHLKTCERCSAFHKQLKRTNRALGALLPVGPLTLMKLGVLAHIPHAGPAAAGSAATGSSAGAGAGAASGAGAGAVGAGAGAVGAGVIGTTASSTSGFVSAGIAALGTKTAAGLAAAALVTAGAVATSSQPHRTFRPDPLHGAAATAGRQAAGAHAAGSAASAVRATAASPAETHLAATHTRVSAVTPRLIATSGAHGTAASTRSASGSAASSAGVSGARPPATSAASTNTTLTPTVGSGGSGGTGGSGGPTVSGTSSPPTGSSPAGTDATSPLSNAVGTLVTGISGTRTSSASAPTLPGLPGVVPTSAVPVGSTTTPAGSAAPPSAASAAPPSAASLVRTLTTPAALKP